MNDRISIISTGVLIVLFLIFGLLDILNFLVPKIIIFGLFLGIIVNILIVKSKEEDKKNLP